MALLLLGHGQEASMQKQQVFRRKQEPSVPRRPAIVVSLLFVSVFLSVFATGLTSAPAAEATHGRSAATPSAGQSTSKGKLVDDLQATQRPYDCCSDNLKNCLEQNPVCPLATRLQRSIVRMAADGLSKAQIEAALAQRRATMLAGQPAATIAVDEQFRAGSPKAAVVLAIYACPRNPACAKLIPDLYWEVTSGRLKDKATLVYRPFFPADDREATECGRGLYAAAYQGQFWPYLVHLCLNRENLSQTTIRDWAASHGLDRCIFDQTCEQTSTASWLQAARKEGLANGVTSAPAAFINGRRIQGTVDLETLVDLAEEEHERLTTGDQAVHPKELHPKKARSAKHP
jgi:protein-disulfide isomerase